MLRHLLFLGIVAAVGGPASAAPGPQADCPVAQFVNAAAHGVQQTAITVRQNVQRAADAVGEQADLTGRGIARCAQYTGDEIGRQARNIGRGFQDAAVRIWQSVRKSFDN